MDSATLHLFNAIQVDQKQKRDLPASVLERTVHNGYLLDPAIDPTPNLLDAVEKVIGISGEKANAAFHKSWAAIENSPIEVLFFQQIIHYVTTYGFERLGIYHQNTVYIPYETLNIPNISEDIPLTVVHALNSDEILERIIRLGAGIALAQQTIDDIMTIVQKNHFASDFLPKISNRELQARLYDFYGLVPDEPLEYLRYIVYKLTGETLLVKNEALIAKLKQSSTQMLDTLLEQSPSNLASIFLRYKPLFLAMKVISTKKTFFNRLRKQANKLHKPLPEDYFNSITVQIKRQTLDLVLLSKKLEHISIFRKIRLAYALKQRTCAGDSTVYRVRTGRGWATDFFWPDSLAPNTQKALELVLASIVEEIKPNVAGKNIYIPPHIHYTLPATEKQFTGHFPTGSYVSTSDNIIVGIHWFNTTNRIDLDLSLLAATGKFGWDGNYRSGDHTILFSGDMTNAPLPNGATELFYIKHASEERFVLIANYYNFDANDPVDTKILLAQETPKDFGSNYMVNPNHILAMANLKVASKQNILGLIAKVENEVRFYFANINIGNSITSSQKEYVIHARKYLVGYLLDSIDLRQILSTAGANVVDTIPQGEYLNLSPEAIERNTILGLLTSTAPKS